MSKAQYDSVHQDTGHGHFMPTLEMPMSYAEKNKKRTSYSSLSGSQDMSKQSLLSSSEARSTDSARVMNRGRLSARAFDKPTASDSNSSSGSHDKGDKHKDKEHGKDKKKEDLKTIKFQATTLDAALFAASRLSSSDGSLSFFDTIGYLWCFVVHMLSIMLQYVCIVLTFSFTVELLEDPYEHKSFQVLEDVLVKGIEARTPLLMTIPESGIPLTKKESKEILKMCAKALEDLEFAHCVFLILFLGIVFKEMLTVLFRVKLVLSLPSRKELEDDDDDDESGGEDQHGWPKHSLQNHKQDNHFVREMKPAWKMVCFWLFSLHLLFLVLVFWTFAKWIVLLHNIVKVAKMCLKLGFLLKFAKLLLIGYGQPNLRRHMGDGGFKVPKPSKSSVTYMWGTWLSTVVKIILAIFCTFLIVYVFFRNVFTIEILCERYADAVPSYVELQGQRISERVNSIGDFF